MSGVSSEFGDLTPSIGLSISLAGWKLSLYSIVGDGFVKPGDALRFFHEEGGYLSRSGSVGTFPPSFSLCISSLIAQSRWKRRSLFVGTWPTRAIYLWHYMASGSRGRRRSRRLLNACTHTTSTP